VSVNCNVCGLDFDGPHVMDTSGEAMHPLRVDCINALRARLAQAEAEAARVRAMLDEDEALRDAVRENLPECTCDSDGNLGGEVDRVEFAGEELRRAQAKLAECVDKAAAIIGTGPEMAEGPNHGVVLAALDWLVTKKPLRREIALLVVHGVLHLLGYDHETLADEKIMFPLQERILKSQNYG
jgi:hypothetical protein